MRSILSTSLCSSLVVALATCGGGKARPPAPVPAPTPAPAPAPTPTPTPDPGQHDLDLLPPPPDRETELFPPAWKKVGRGQTISFSTAAIDQDLDEVAVTVTSLPKTARFDALTQTVTWTPDKSDGKLGVFELAVANRTTGSTSTVRWEIAVVAGKVAPPVAPWAGDEAELLFTIREPRRLEAINKALPFAKLLADSATMVRATLAPDAAAKLGPVDGRALYDSFLASLARTHGNPRLDPTAAGFDKAAFADPASWKLVAVRPRIDKKFHELRLVYRATRAAEPVFAMFRVRPVQDLPTLPPEARLENNKVFAQLLWKHLLTADGGLDPKLRKNAAAHGKQVAAFVTELLAYKGSQPWAQAAFIALPTEARMGGGSARAADGSYASGDGWAWSVQKPMLTPDGTGQRYVEIGIPGFWTHTVPSPDGTAWVGKCAPKFDPDVAGHTPGWEALCRKAQGQVDLPDTVDGKVVPAKLDAVNRFVAHKKGPAVELLALDDGRRDHGEENGMTCAQCHIRTFGVRDYGDPATADPRAGTPRAPNRALPTLNFQIVPSERWEAFTLEVMQDQACKARVHLEAALGKAPRLTCALTDATAPRITAPLAP